MSFLCLSAHHLMWSLLGGTDIQNSCSPPYQGTPRESAAHAGALGCAREKLGTYRDRRAGSVCPVARGGEGSQGPAAPISPGEKVRLAQAHTGGGLRGNPRETEYSSSNKWHKQSVRVWKRSARARVNKHYTAGWLLFKLNQYTQTSRKWMGWSILLISH